VGVDVEWIKPRRNLSALARRALAPDVAKRIEEAPAELRVGAFYTEWARREATVKCHGTGLWELVPEAPVAVADLDVGPGYAAAVAVAVAVAGETMPPLRRFTIEPADLPVG
jgi:4'-phosphopantetheinyl transferase